ncbi:MAG TPA: GMC family oxidoreductase, partial [Rhizobiales bacterium]|nr:GMC family oxidoreductase [Hyphomicrobiales bacterium]
LSARDGQPERAVNAPVVVVGAGTLGSTEIMLRSQENGLALSRHLGEQFSGNGDVIAFGYNNDVEIDGIGIGQRKAPDGYQVGPVIAGLIDMRNTSDLADAMVIQEGAIPSLLAPLLPAMMAGGSPMFGDDTDEGDSLEEAKRSAKSLFAGAYTGAVRNTQTFLVMAHDTASGKIEIKGDRINVDWPDAGKAKVYEKISATLRAATAATGGTFINNPMWAKSLGRNLVSVHPLGGCCMGDDVDNGVVDHKNRAFASSGEVLDGLFVMDGSAMSRSLGVNPSLTITAISERAMIHFAKDHGLELDTTPANAALV